jgi:hypothetical protein
VFSAFPPLISVAKLCYLRRLDLLHFLRQLPRSFRAEVVFLLTGNESAPPTEDSPLPFHITLSPKKSTLDKPDDQSIQEASVSIPFPRFSLQLTKPPTYSSGRSSLKEPEEQEEVTADSERSPQHDHAPSERTRSPTPLVADVPLAMVRDIILALPRNETTESTVGLICATHGLDPLTTASVMRVVREDLSPADERQRYVVA